MKSVLEFQKRKQSGPKITMVTSYDFWSARLINETDIDCILVGDSLAMVMHGYSSTIPADTQLMAIHTAAVARGAKDKFIIGDLCFLSYRKGLTAAMEAVDSLMKSGAHAVKLEGVYGHQDVVEQIVQSGVPVMGHIGLTPQSVHQLGGFHVQGRDREKADDLIEQGLILQNLGCFALVLECVPTDLAVEITNELSIPTIGIGAGPHTDGQVLVLHDLLGLNSGFKPKFLKRYLNGFELVSQALSEFHHEVQNGEFPSEKESYACK